MLIRWKNKDKSSSSSSSNTQTLPASNKSSSKKKRKFGKGDDWEKGRDDKSSEGSGSRGDDEVRRSRNRREDPRRHTLSGENQFASQQMLRSAEFESTIPRGYPLHNSAMLFDDDPGIMSEVETSSTGFRRGGKQRSSLPVVRTPSKTLERPLGLVFLQYRSETKRALLPNEITSIDTVKALFVRSFSKQLTMEYLDSPNVKIYIHDSSKDMFYELEDLRSHLRDIRDRSVLRLFEATDVSGGTLSSTLSITQPTWDQDQSYFSEPEFDSEFQHQHIHKTKGSKISTGGHAPYYMPTTASLPRGATLPRNYSMAKVTPAPYDDSYYQYPSRTGSITPVIDEETSDSELMDDTYSLSYGMKIPAGPARPYTTAVIPPYDTTRIRVEHMERQLANLTGLVQKALTHSPSPSPREVISMGLPPTYRAVSTEDMDKHSGSSTASLPDNKTVSFEKSVSFSEDPPTNSPKQHSPQHTVDSKPSKPAIKSSTLPRTSSQERDRHKPVHLKPLVSGGSTTVQYEPQHSVYRADLQLTPEMYNQFRGLQKKAKDLRQDMRNLRRMSQAQAHSTRESIKDTFIKIRSILVSGSDGLRLFSGDSDCLRINREEDLYKQEMLRLESDLTDLESTVEELRGNVINRKTRVNMSDVENMALVLSKSSKTVADLKIRFPGLQNSIKTLLNKEMEKVLSEETFIKDEPERLENALRRCKKLTGTLVTLKRLASVQEQRLPDARLSPTTDEPPPATPNKTPLPGSVPVGENEEKSGSRSVTPRAENALDVLLDELQTFSQPPPAAIPTEHSGTLRRLHSYPSGDTKPPVPERSSELLSKRVPPPPPPRTSSKSPLASPTNPMAPARNTSSNVSSPVRKSTLPRTADKDKSLNVSNSSSSENVNSQEDPPSNLLRQEYLEQKHQELLRKQRALQEQYTRLQRTPPPDLVQLKKTGSEGNIIQKMGLSLTASAPMSGSMSHFGYFKPTAPLQTVTDPASAAASAAGSVTTNKLYETDIL